jgi:hypothetical protein
MTLSCPLSVIELSTWRLRWSTAWLTCIPASLPLIVETIVVPDRNGTGAAQLRIVNAPNEGLRAAEPGAELPNPGQ